MSDSNRPQKFSQINTLQSLLYQITLELIFEKFRQIAIGYVAPRILNLYTYIHIYIYIYVHVRVRIFKSCVCTCVFVYVSVYHMHVQVCACVRVRHLCVYMCVYVYVELYRVAKTHRNPYLGRSFSAKVTHI